ncbi:hypothetical protein B0H14DRAFT_3444437 [Mycena olivaceomarginata]|nr:hypothetical protein B0H14DRAFT_3444437 [Mycena olivaceomarginata]
MIPEHVRTRSLPPPLPGAWQCLARPQPALPKKVVGPGSRAASPKHRCAAPPTAVLMPLSLPPPAPAMSAILPVIASRVSIIEHYDKKAPAIELRCLKITLLTSAQIRTHLRPAIHFLAI